MKEYLFIYGTLLPEYAPSETLDSIAHLNCVGKASVKGRLYDLGKYPGAILDPSSRMKVIGRVYEIPENKGVLRALDSYEEYNPDDLDNSLFIREQTTATLVGGRRVRCWIYVYNQNPGTAPLVSDGDYKKYQAA
jgi:gamma-glutamylcyclotransferase (GGCT)/AIG2-like uncharacterized protein YtfP